MKRTTAFLIAGYIAANTSANLILIAVPLELRARVSIAIALVLVAFDITSRDKLDDIWHGDRRKLGRLILAGAALSAIINLAAWPVALASCLAFVAAGAADTVAYSWLRGRPWMVRANGSNVASGLVDSAVFLGIAASLGVMPWFTVPMAFIGQVLAKTFGGALWSILIAVLTIKTSSMRGRFHNAEW